MLRRRCQWWVVAALLVVCASSSASAIDEPQRWALLIGINDYTTVQHLQYCVADQEALAKQLIASGFPSDQVFVLDDAAKLQKYRPSKLNIEHQLELVLGMPSAGDTMVVGFNGHGVQIDGKSYLCPADCDLEHPKETMIALEKVFDDLSACKASLKLLIVDACRNNVEIGANRAIDIDRSQRGFGESLERPPEGISLLTSCSPGQFAREHDKLGHGVFIYFVLQGLAGKAADEDGVVRLGRLLDYTMVSTQKYVYDQFNAAQRPYYRVEGSGPVVLCRIDRKLPALPPKSDVLVAPFGPTQARAAQQAQAKELAIPMETTNSIGMKLALIPRGEFVMGGAETVSELSKAFPNTKAQWVSDERPQHRVHITKPFYLGTHEVTLGQFLKFHQAANYKCDCEKDGKGGWGFVGAVNQQPSKFVPWNWGFDGQTMDHPVVNVSWNDATEMCKWLSQQEGQKYRLPTEAEWEFAARAGTTTRYYHGADPEGLAAVENVADGTAKEKFTSWTTMSARDGFVFTSVVGSFRPNAFGLLDILGNVEGWCSDWYEKDYYSRSPADDPKGPDTGVSRVIRGGSWRTRPVYCLAATRYYKTPSDRNNNLGFRVVCEPR